MSTVTPKLAFSTSERMLVPFRSLLKAKIVERLICTGNWLSGSNNMSVYREFMNEIDTLNDSIEVENGNIKILTICFIQLYLSSNFNLSCFCFVDDVIGATEEAYEAI